MAADEIAILDEEPTSTVATSLLRRYFEELDARFPGGFAVARTIAAPPEELRDPHGAFLVVVLAGEPVACGAVRKIEPTVGEIKRMWVAPTARGKGVARRLLGALEARAAALGCNAVRLDTHPALDEALGLYRSSGYVAIPAYNDNAYAAHWFEKRLSAC